MTYRSIDQLTVELSDGVLSVTLNRPDTLNSLSEAMLTGIAEALTQAATDPDVRVVKLSGAGRGFCSGAGISAEDISAKSVNGPEVVLDAANDAVRAIVALPKPVVAVVQGPAAGVGVSLATACDVVLASEKAFFMLAFTKIGLMPDGGASALIAAAVGRIRAQRMALLAERITAAEAYDWGLVTSVHARRGTRRRGGQGARPPWPAGRPCRCARPSRPSTTPPSPNWKRRIAREREGQLILLTSKDFRRGHQGVPGRPAGHLQPITDRVRLRPENQWTAADLVGTIDR